MPSHFNHPQEEIRVGGGRGRGGERRGGENGEGKERDIQKEIRGE